MSTNQFTGTATQPQCNRNFVNLIRTSTVQGPLAQSRSFLSNQSTIGIKLTYKILNQLSSTLTAVRIFIQLNPNRSIFHNVFAYCQTDWLIIRRHVTRRLIMSQDVLTLIPVLPDKARCYEGPGLNNQTNRTRTLIRPRAVSKANVVFQGNR